MEEYLSNPAVGRCFLFRRFVTIYLLSSRRPRGQNQQFEAVMNKIFPLTTIRGGRAFEQLNLRFILRQGGRRMARAREITLAEFEKIRTTTNRTGGQLR